MPCPPSKADLAQAKTPREEIVLAEQMQPQAADTQDDRATQYVRCVMARELTTAAGE